MFVIWIKGVVWTRQILIILCSVHLPFQTLPFTADLNTVFIPIEKVESVMLYRLGRLSPNAFSWLFNCNFFSFFFKILVGHIHSFILFCDFLVQGFQGRVLNICKLKTYNKTCKKSLNWAALQGAFSGFIYWTLPCEFPSECLLSKVKTMSSFKTNF